MVARKAMVSVSGGKGSWATWKIAAQIHGVENTVGLFSDTLMEDADLYRFLVEGAANVYGVRLPDGWDQGRPDEVPGEPTITAALMSQWYRAVAAEYVPQLVWLAEGRDVWEVFFDKRFLGNSRIDPCSKILKRDLIRSWIEEHYQPDEVVCYIGIDWTESHRFTKAVPYWQPYEVRAPLTEPEWQLDGQQVMKWLESEGIESPRLYAMGFPHNNCGGFCIKSGLASFRILLEKLPDRYAYHERRELELREHLGKDVAILTDRSMAARTAMLGLTPDEIKWDRRRKVYRVRKTGEIVAVPNKAPLTLRDYRLRLQGASSLEEAAGGDAVLLEDMQFEYGGCACFTPDDYEKDVEVSKVALGMPAVRSDE